MHSRIPLSESIIHIDLKTDISSINTDYIREFEDTLEHYYNREKKIVALNSGTSAIHLALILSGVVKDDEVLCQSFTYVATANPILYQNAKPVFIDSEKDTWSMCPLHLELAIKDRLLNGKKPKAIIFVHIYGMPAKIDEIVSVAQKYNITLIEDAAEALGSEYKGGKCGAFGDFGILSFNNNKIISTMGGGALICKTEKEKQEAIFYATQAKEKTNYYKHKKLGYNYRMNSFAAFIGISQIIKIKEILSKRRCINDFYLNYFLNFKGINLLKENVKDCYSNHWLTCVLIDENITGFSNKKLVSFYKENRIESRLLWRPLHTQSIFKKHLYYGQKIAENLFETGLCLPSGTELSSDDIKIITSSINKLL